MSGLDILNGVLEEAASNNSDIEDIICSLDLFQRSALCDLLEFVADPQNYILTEEKKEFITSTIKTMNEEQKVAISFLLIYARAMYAL